jgi:hypothetical protein
MERWSSLRFFVIVLLALQVVAVALAWILNPVGQQSQTQFALLLAADLVAFTMISYAARRGGEGEEVKEWLLLTGSGFVMVFMLGVLLVEVV